MKILESQAHLVEILIFLFFDDIDTVSKNWCVSLHMKQKGTFDIMYVGRLNFDCT
jgi:hypothetical protein